MLEINRNNTIFLVFLLEVLFLIISCNESKKSNQENSKNKKLKNLATINKIIKEKEEFNEIHFTDFSNHFFLREILDSSITYIKLETSKECLIGKISKIEIYQDKIYILDSYKAKKLFVFNMNGDFIGIIGNNGKGPKEYYIPNDFYIDKEKNIIMVADPYNYKIIYYSMQGDFIRYKNFFQVQAINKINNNYCFYLWYYTNIHENEKINFRLLTTYDNLKTKNLYFPNNMEETSYYTYPFHCYKDTLLFFENFRNHIYEFNASNNHFKVRYLLNFNQNLTLNDTNEKIDPTFIKNNKKKNKNKKSFSGFFLETEQHLILEILDFNFLETKYVFFSKESKEYYSGNVSLFSRGLGIGVLTSSKHKNKIVSFIPGRLAKDFIEEGYLEKTNKDHYFKIESSNIDELKKTKSMDNPILCLFKLKKF